jgi:hypothetical protein
MLLIVLYSPALVLLPIGLFAGIFFVLFSAGLFILLGSLYLLAMAFIGLIEVGNQRRSQRPRRRLVAAPSAPRPPRTGPRATPALAAVRSGDGVRYESVRTVARHAARPEQENPAVAGLHEG